MNAKTSGDTCYHRGCDCPIEDGAVEQSGHQYCSRGCAKGQGCDHPDCMCSTMDFDAGDNVQGRMQGEGNRDADRRYREGVRETVDETTAEERAADARSLKDKEKTRARDAEREGKSHARS